MRDCLGSRNANTDLLINRSREVIVFLLPFTAFFTLSICKKIFVLFSIMML